MFSSSNDFKFENVELSKASRILQRDLKAPPKEDQKYFVSFILDVTLAT